MAPAGCLGGKAGTSRRQGRWALVDRRLPLCPGEVPLFWSACLGPHKREGTCLLRHLTYCLIGKHSWGATSHNSHQRPQRVPQRQSSPGLSAGVDVSEPDAWSSAQLPRPQTPGPEKHSQLAWRRHKPCVFAALSPRAGLGLAAWVWGRPSHLCAWRCPPPSPATTALQGCLPYPCPSEPDRMRHRP